MTNPLKYGLCFLVLSLLLVDVSAQLQPFLLLEKPGTKQRIRYFAGDEILFKTYENNEYRSGILTGFNDSAFVVNKNEMVRISEVRLIADKSKVGTTRGIAYTAFSTVPFFFFLSAANNLFNTGDRPLIGEEVYDLSIVFGTIGVLAMLYNGRKYKLNRRWRILIIDHESP